MKRETAFLAAMSLLRAEAERPHTPFTLLPVLGFRPEFLTGAMQIYNNHALLKRGSSAWFSHSIVSQRSHIHKIINNSCVKLCDDGRSITLWLC